METYAVHALDQGVLTLQIYGRRSSNLSYRDRHEKVLGPGRIIFRAHFAGRDGGSYLREYEPGDISKLGSGMLFVKRELLLDVTRDPPGAIEVSQEGVSMLWPVAVHNISSS